MTENIKGYSAHDGKAITEAEHEEMFQALINDNSQPLILMDRFQSDRIFTAAETWKVMDPEGYAKGLQADWEDSISEGDVVNSWQELRAELRA